MTPEELHQRLMKYAQSMDKELNRDRELVMALMTALLKNEERYGYRSCPCRLSRNDREADRDIFCPCNYMEPDVAEYGSCYCGLYVSKDWNEGKTPHVKVPERRPMEKR